VIENFIGIKSWMKILEGLKQKVGIFIGPKTYLTLKKKNQLTIISYYIIIFHDVLLIF